MIKGTRNKRLWRATVAMLTAVALAAPCIIGAGAVGVAEYESENARAVSDSIYPSIPVGAYRLNVNVNSRQVLSGRIFNTGGTTYVPMLSFSYWIGDFKGSYNARTRTATLTGTNLKITARAGDSYINANDRYFYTVGKVLLVGEEIYVPILPMVKALNSYASWDSASNSFLVRSGDSRLLKNGAQVYQADQVYWLSRIISAEAQGEPMEGKIAVGNVVLNRVLSSQFPNTIYGVIFDKKYGIQFSPVANGTIYNTPTMDSIIAAKICLEGYSLSGDILYFVNPKKAPGSWISKSRPYAFRIGNHTFYN